MASLVITFIADDKPGLVNLLSKTISENGGNWVDSSLTRLHGKFTGILTAEVPDEQSDQLCTALRNLPPDQIRVYVETTTPATSEGYQLVRLDLVGHDKTGIVRDISATLARLHVNVLKLDTELTPGSMSNELLFRAEGELQVPGELDLDLLQEALEEIAADLMVDITLGDNPA